MSLKAAVEFPVDDRNGIPAKLVAVLIGVHAKPSVASERALSDNSHVSGTRNAIQLMDWKRGGRKNWPVVPPGFLLRSFVFHRTKFAFTLNPLRS